MLSSWIWSWRHSWATERFKTWRMAWSSQFFQNLILEGLRLEEGRQKQYCIRPRKAVVAIQTKHNEKVGRGDKTRMRGKEQSEFPRWPPVYVRTKGASTARGTAVCTCVAEPSDCEMVRRQGDGSKPVFRKTTYLQDLLKTNKTAKSF